MKLLEKVRTLTHQLREDLEGDSRIFADERAESRAAHEQSLCFFRCICIGDVGRVGRKPLYAERLARCDDCRNKTPSGSDPVTQYHVSVEHDRNSIGGTSLLVYLEARGPARAGAICREHSCR